MSNILITTLGKGRRNEDGYLKIKYRLEEKQSRETPFIGQALIELVPQIDKIVVLGTTGSIWDAWWQVDETLFEKHADFLDMLSEKVKNEEEDVSALSKLSEILSNHLRKDVECKYIPDGLDEKSQLDILQVIDSIGEKGDNVYLDVTHGFRHLPMIEMLSAFLQKNKYNIRHIYYGALEKSMDGVAPVIDLKGLLNLQEWIEAVAILNETDNVMTLARIPTMKDFRADLEQYQFFIQMNNVGNARGSANRIRGMINEGRLPPEGVLFKEKLLKVFDWGADQEYAKRQLSQAKAAFEKGDYLRAIILLNEAVISSYVDDSRRVMDIDCRTEAENKLYRSNEYNWHILRRLRNSTAHDGTKNDRLEKKIKDIRRSRENFEKGFKELIKWAEQQVK